MGAGWVIYVGAGSIGQIPIDTCLCFIYRVKFPLTLFA